MVQGKKIKQTSKKTKQKRIKDREINIGDGINKTIIKKGRAINDSKMRKMGMKRK